MPSTPLSQLPRLSDFTTVDTNDTTSILTNPNLTTIDNSAVQYSAGTTANPTGTWFVNGYQATAGEIIAARFYTAFLSADSTSQTYLSSMSANAAAAKAAASFSKVVAARAEAASSTTTFIRADLITAVGELPANFGMSASQFVTAVLPDEPAGATYTATQFAALATVIDQYSNNKLTDNSVLQNKFNVVSSNRNLCLDGISNLLKGWATFLQGLERNI